MIKNGDQCVPHWEGEIWVSAGINQADIGRRSFQTEGRGMPRAKVLRWEQICFQGKEANEAEAEWVGREGEGNRASGPDQVPPGKRLEGAGFCSEWNGSQFRVLNREGMWSDVWFQRFPLAAVLRTVGEQGHEQEACPGSVPGIQVIWGSCGPVGSSEGRETGKMALPRQDYVCARSLVASLQSSSSSLRIVKKINWTMGEFCCNQMLNLSLSYLIYEMNESVKMQTCNASKWQWMALKYWWKEDCSVDSSVGLSCCHLLPNVTEIGEKADKVTSVPFQTTKVQGGTALEPWCQISTHSRVRCFLDICNSPSMLWLVRVWSLYVFEIDIDINIETASSSLQNGLTEGLEIQ